MDLRGPFRFLRGDDFGKLTLAEKVMYLDGATAELRRRGEELRSITQLIGDGALKPSNRIEVKSRLSGGSK